MIDLDATIHPARCPKWYEYEVELRGVQVEYIYCYNFTLRERLGRQTPIYSYIGSFHRVKDLIFITITPLCFGSHFF